MTVAVNSARTNGILSRGSCQPIESVVGNMGNSADPGLPNLALDFSQPLPSSITFTRADSTSCATYFGADGLLKIAAANIPRIDYDPATGVCKGLLIEESRANLLKSSRDLRSAGAGNPITAWTNTDTTVTVNQTGFDGVANSASLMTEGSAGNSETFQSQAGFTAGSTITNSAVLKRGNTDWVRFMVTDNSVTGGYHFWFNLATGATGSSTVIGTGTSPSLSTVNLGSGWYRIIASCIPTASYTIGRLTISSAASNGSFSRVANSTYIVDCAQLEVGAFATSYIPTTTTSLTRAADSASMTGTNFSSWFNQSEGTFLVDGSIEAMSTAAYPAVICAGSNTDRFTVYAIGSSKTMTASVRVGGADTYNSGNMGNASSYKAALAFTTDDAMAAINGVLGAADSVPTGLPPVSSLGIGNLNGTVPAATQHIRRLAFWPKRLPNATLKALTA